MSDLIISKVNEAYIKLECEKSLAQEISDHFTFHVPGYQFTPAYKNRLWDGKIRLLDLRTYSMYYGLIPYIQKFCDDRNYKIYYYPEVNLTNNFSIKEAEQFIETLSLPIVPRDYQLSSFVHAIRNKRSLLLSPTASGKSLILYLILRKIQDEDHKKGLNEESHDYAAKKMHKCFKDNKGCYIKLGQIICQVIIY